MQITPLSPHVGVEIAGVTGAAAFDARVVGERRRLLDRHGVVVFREAAIDDDMLLPFSANFGRLVVSPTGEHDRPEIQTITMHPAATNLALAAYRRGNFLWHIDGVTDQLPQKGTVLSAREIGNSGEGGTEFATTYAAYDALSDDDKRLIDDLQVGHSFAAAQDRANPDASDEFRASLHRARPFAPTSPRLLLRTTLVGEEAVA